MRVSRGISRWKWFAGFKSAEICDPTIQHFTFFPRFLLFFLLLFIPEDKIHAAWRATSYVVENSDNARCRLCLCTCAPESSSTYQLLSFEKVLRIIGVFRRGRHLSSFFFFLPSFAFLLGRLTSLQSFEVEGRMKKKSHHMSQEGDDSLADYSWRMSAVQLNCMPYDGLERCSRDCLKDVIVRVVRSPTSGSTNECRNCIIWSLICPLFQGRVNFPTTWETKPHHLKILLGLLVVSPELFTSVVLKIQFSKLLHLSGNSKFPCRLRNWALSFGDLVGSALNKSKRVLTYIVLKTR